MTAPAATILLVNADREARAGLQRLLTREGYDVLSASSGEAGLEKTIQFNPDLVLLDINMPGLDGIEIARRIKADPALAHIFVVHVSAQHAPAGERMKALEAGADGYISLPVENEVLLSRLRAFLRHKKTMDELRASEARYRSLFESNPLPIWIYDAATFRILDVNAAAVQHYGFTRDEFLSRTVPDLAPEEFRTAIALDLRDASLFPARREWRHRNKAGAVIEMDATQQSLTWMDRPAVAVLLSDVTARNQAERERIALLEKYEREFKSLKSVSRFSHGTPGVARRTESDRAALKARFSELTVRYTHAIERALEQKVFKVDHDVSAELQRLGEDLFQLTAAPRDVVELHCATMTKLVPTPTAPRAQGLLEAGRLAIVELMGYVLAAYRNAFLQKNSAT